MRWLLFILLLPGAACAQDAAHRAQIKELMRVTGSAELGVQFAKAVSTEMARHLRESRPDIPGRAVAVVNQEVLKLFEERIDELLERIVPVYEKHFSAAEIDALLAFYRTPAGRKAIAVMPAVMSESVAAGQAWGRSLGPEIGRRVQAALKREGIGSGIEPKK
jgi:hypothetical protein